MLTKLPLLLMAVLCATSIAMAQPGSCVLDLGPDHQLCQGENVTLVAAGGFPNYMWNTGSTASSITVGASGVYSCQVSYPSGELVTNGNFSAGNAGFTSQFTANTNLNLGDGYYWVGTNATSHHPQFVGTGTGNFLIVNSGWASALFMVWCQDVLVCPGQTYTLTYRARTISNATPARLQWWINGVATGPEVNLPAYNAGWQTITHTWTSPPGATTASICLRAMSGEGVGNDFGLDDISMSGTIVLNDDVLVTVTPLPVVDLGPNATLCAGQSLSLDAGVPNGSYLWQDGSTAPGFVVTGPGDYGVEVTANGCSASDALTVNYNPLPVVDLGADLSLCSGETVVLSVTQPGATYTWQDGSTAGTFTVSGPGTYSVGVWLNGCFATDAVNVTYNPIPSITLGPDISLCTGQQAILNATTAGATYLWQDGSTTPTLNVTQSGTYSVAVTVNGCTGYSAVNVAVEPLPAVDLGPDQTVCPGSTVLLNATVPGGSYLWQNGSTAATFSAQAPGIYTVQVTANGCQASDAVNIAHHTLPVIALGPDVTICQGNTTALGVNVPGATYLWSTGAIGSTIATAQAGIYWVDATLNGCTVRDSITVNVTALPLVDLGYDVNVCPGQTTVLDANQPGATYLWNTGATTPSIAAGPGNYSVSVTVNGCSAEGLVNVNAHPAAQVELGADITLCPGQQLVLNIFQPGASYLWNTGSTGASFTVTQAGTYSATLTTANGCTATDAIAVTFATPTPVDLGPDVTICQGETMILDASTVGATYLWSNGATTAAIAVTTAGTYSVTVTQGTCTVNDAITVSVVNVPQVDLGPDATICPGDELLLDASTPGASYLWSTGSTTPTLSVDQGGTYSVTVTLASGCSGSDAVVVSLASPDAVDLGPDITLCTGNTVTLDPGLPGATYLWSTGATTPTLNVAGTGSYWVQVTQGTCLVGDTVTVTTLPTPQVELGVDQTLCAGESAVLDATWPGANYAWSTGAQDASITVTTSGTYAVIVDLNGCTTTDQVIINFQSPPSVDLGPDLTLCAGEQLILDASTPGASYLWTTGSTGPSLTITATGNYGVVVTQGACTVSDEVTVTVLDPGMLDLGSDTVLCEGESMVLDATVPGATYLWTDGLTAAVRTITASGTYAVTASVGPCSVSDAITVTVLSNPVVDLGADVEICPGTSASFTAAQPGATYLWHDGSTGPEFTTDTEGTVSVIVTVNNCSSTGTALVTAVEGPIVSLGNDTTLCEGQALVFVVAQAGATYLWDDGSNAGTRTVTDPGTYWVLVERNGCTASDTVTVDLFSAEAVDLGPDLVLCPGVSVVLTMVVPGTAVLWSTGSTATAISVEGTGTYWVQVQVAACAASDTIEVRVVDLVPPDLGPALTGCEGDTLVLGVDPGPAAVLWSTGSTADSIAVSRSGIYSVSMELEGCTVEDMVQVTVLAFIDTLELGAQRHLCPGDMLVLDAELDREVAYLWSTGNSSSFIQVQAPDTYTVHVVGDCVDAHGTAVVLEGDCHPFVHVPNTFTPNNDGINDLFLPVLSVPAERYRLELFDRWGAAVFSTTDPGLGWNGQMGGTAAQDGVYVWVLEYRSISEEGTKRERLVGHVTLLR